MPTLTKKNTANLPAPPEPTAEADTPKGIYALDVSHAPLKPQLEKSRTLLATPQTCTLCSLPTPSSGAGTLICPSPSCTSITHLTCLATHFLATEKSTSATANNSTTSLLPTTGTCPTCSTPLHWQTLVQELSLRMRGEKEVQALFKPVRTRKRKATDEQVTAGAVDDEDGEESELELDVLQDEDEDGWHHLSDSGSEADVLDEVPPIPSPKGRKKATPAFRKPRELVGAAAKAKGKAKGKGKGRATGPEVVVEDSDVDDDEVVL